VAVLPLLYQGGAGERGERSGGSTAREASRRAISRDRARIPPARTPPSASTATSAVRTVRCDGAHDRSHTTGSATSTSAGTSHACSLIPPVTSKRKASPTTTALVPIATATATQRAAARFVAARHVHRASAPAPATSVSDVRAAARRHDGPPPIAATHSASGHRPSHAAAQRLNAQTSPHEPSGSRRRYQRSSVAIASIARACREARRASRPVRATSRRGSSRRRRHPYGRPHTDGKPRCGGALCGATSPRRPAVASSPRRQHPTLSSTLRGNPL
jgi:hypothetical protein